MSESIPQRYPKAELIKIERIIITERVRVIVPRSKIEFLKDSMDNHGQLQPIILDTNYELVAGYRRICAAKELGWERIWAVIREFDSELEKLDVEIQENYQREDLTVYEFEMALLRRKELYEKKYPHTKWGGSRSSDGHVDKLSTRGAERFTRNTSREYGLSERTIQRHIRVAEAIKNKVFSEERISKFKANEISYTKMLKILKELEKKETQKEVKKKPKEKITQNQNKKPNKSIRSVKPSKQKEGLKNQEKIKKSPSKSSIHSQQTKVSDQHNSEGSQLKNTHIPKESPSIFERKKTPHEKLLSDIFSKDDKKNTKAQDKIKKTQNCKNCKFAMVRACPFCIGQLVICPKHNYVIKKGSSLACDLYRE